MEQRYKQKAGFWASVKEIIVLLIIVFLIRTFGFGLYVVPTGSMETTMLIGERFFADKFTILFSKPKHGDIVSFNDPIFPYSDNKIQRLYQEYIGFPGGPSNWTKRVIGVPGDRLKGVIEDGKPVIYRNDQKIDEPYLNQYPLLALWKDEPNKLQQEAFAHVSNYCTSQEEAEIELSRLLESQWDWRPYDARYSFETQIFYRMNPAYVVRVQANPGSVDGCTITHDGMLFKESGVPVSYAGMKTMHSGGSTWNGTDEFSIELGPKEYWLMGDNRRGSFDCRFFGPVREHLIHGKIVFRIFSLDTRESWLILDLLKHPIGFWRNARWSRCMQPVR